MKILRKVVVYIIPLLFTIQLHAQAVLSVSGLVKSKEGAPLIGATIQQKNGKHATSSDKEGKFTLSVPSGSSLVISYIGYDSQTLLATKEMQVFLEEANSFLNEVEVVVNKGYGQSKRLEISSSIASVKGKDIQNQPAYNLGTLLQGKATKGAKMQMLFQFGVARCTNFVHKPDSGGNFFSINRK